MGTISFTEDETFSFIEKVHSRDCLWNIKSNKYKDTVVREHAWKEIGATLNISGPDAYRKFKSLREKYHRELKKVKKSSKSELALSKARLWPFFNHLRFLDEVYKARRPCYVRNWHLLKDRSDQINDSTEDKFHSYTTTSVSGSVEGSSLEVHDNVDASDIAFPFKIKSESPLSVTGSSINDDEELSSAPMLSKATPRVRTPSPRQLSSPLNQPKKIRRSDQATSLENTFTENTDKLISAISNARLLVEPKPFDGVIEFIRNTLISLPRQQSKQLEKEIMGSCIKYRYK